MTDWSGEDYAKVSSLQRTIAGMVPGGYAVGADASKRMIATADAAGAPAESGPWFGFADARRLPFGEHFDVVVSFNALHWVPEQRQALGQIATVLRPGAAQLFRWSVRGSGPVWKRWRWRPAEARVGLTGSTDSPRPSSTWIRSATENWRHRRD